ncbi:MAG: arginine--tRNA ligase [Patescibacteria group bacterium]|nr:arginine--tRNA ligase [Patescibacteria group bacterium]MDE2438210.1 arginine--tRNA ligase [Patescibacteria group bacterium]
MKTPKEIIHTLLVQAFEFKNREENQTWRPENMNIKIMPTDRRFGDYSASFLKGIAHGTETEEEIFRGFIEDGWNKMDSDEKKYVEPLSAESFKSGFINFRMSDRFYEDAFKESDTWSKGNEGAGKTVILDYFQLNIAKEPHVGHLRSAVIGDALKRVLLARGYRTIADTHVGDWGTQFGILLYAYKKAIAGKSKKIDEIKDNPFVALQELYVLANEEEDVHEKGKAEFAKLEQGDSENRAIWEWMVDISMKKLGDNAARLDLLPFEEHRGESVYESAMPPIVEEALRTGIAKKTDDGAVVVDLSEEGLDEAVLVKSDGATTYLLRDLATIKYRVSAYHFWKNLYVVDNRQSHHFRQVFRVAELLGFEGVGASEHIEFGFMKLPEGAMSTRKGTVVLLEAVLDEAERRARAVIQEKNPGLHNKEAVARSVGLGAIKFFDLSHNRKSDIVFRFEDALSFEGRTGPYIQYTHARLKSILRKSTDEILDHFSVHAALDTKERELLLHSVQLAEVLQRVIEGWFPHLLADYLFELAQAANEFYHSHPILTEKDTEKRTTLLMIVRVVAKTLATGLDLLGIEAPDEM